MAKSQQTFSKSEKEKKRIKKRELKAKKREERKASSIKGGKLEDMLAYVDQYGRITDTPPDPEDKIVVAAEDIILGIPKKSDYEEEDPTKEGKVSFFDDSKGFGFIINLQTQEKHFVHVSGLIDEIKENDKVSFELEKGLRGMNAVKVKKI